MNNKRCVEVLEERFTELSTDELVKVDGKEYNRRNAIHHAISVINSVEEKEKEKSNEH